MAKVMFTAPPRNRRAHAILALISAIGFAGTVAPGAVDARSSDSSHPRTQSLRGVIIALDPGHQLGNSNARFRSRLAQRRFQGRVWKNCNTSGTATKGGYPEATFNWNVARVLASDLRSRGATVVMTRETNDRNHWGPCVWDRGTFGARHHARLMVSIHADGAPPRGYGFHIITPALTPGWTDHIYREDHALARAMKAGMIAAGATPSTYVRNAISIRGDMFSLNVSRIPTVLVELGNMRNSGDAQWMTSTEGQKRAAQSLMAGIVAYLRGANSRHG